MTEHAKRVKEYYIQPAISLIETEHQKKQIGYQFLITTKIWVDQHLPEYRVVIPEEVSWRHNTKEFCSASDWQPGDDIETRFLTYIPTGRVVYDTTKPHKEAIVYEYILESLLGKKDLIHTGYPPVSRPDD